ncbi:hypothetical protein LHJ74_13780 [Streptomyces sp. N2-109]|uniref:NfeD-like C-terminal domain-containing protein n=1 Tax=Streptomyces gossypii TaxID=2883101 RepID=A0ABT2JT79_9ACTN|nr:hypothetical protein [Streptomyces gossypii]MCT2590966.1 hypothetical protein [Streptomyces gossypii]
MADEKEQQRSAFRVRRGDRVCIGGCWREVADTHIERYATGGSATVLVLRTGRRVRLPATALVAVMPVDASL